MVGRHKMAKHIRLMIHDGTFTWSRDEESIKRDAMLDGIYVVRTNEPAERLTAEASVRAYKRLSLVEQLFRCLKGVDLLVRPIHHRLESRVRAHVLICVLAYYVEWHLRRAWRSADVRVELGPSHAPLQLVHGFHTLVRWRRAQLQARNDRPRELHRI